MQGAPRSVSHTNDFVQRRYVAAAKAPERFPSGALAVDYCNRHTIRRILMFFDWKLTLVIVKSILRAVSKRFAYPSSPIIYAANAV
jgi:hypothetical protein